jgi:hypothetical protein
VKVQSDVHYEAIQLDGTDAAIDAIFTAADAHGASIPDPNQLRQALGSVEGGYWVLIGEDHTLRVTHPADFAAHFSSVEDGILDALAADLGPALPASMTEGEFTTSIRWQFEQIDVDAEGKPTGSTSWVSADDEEDAKKHARDNLRVIRHWSEITVSGQKSTVSF